MCRGLKVRVCVYRSARALKERVTTRVGRVITRSHGRFLYKKGAPLMCDANFYLLLSILTPHLLIFTVFYFCFSTFLLFLFVSLLIMDFPHVLEDLGDDFDGAGAASFSFEDFDLGDVSFPQAVAGTSSAAGPSGATGVSGGSSSYPHLSQGDPIPVVHSLETHAWIIRRRPVSFSFVALCHLLLLLWLGRGSCVDF